VTHTSPANCVPDGFADAVLAWGVPQLRDLPWRSTRDPWAVVVSELMLQQTQVARVLPKYLAFIVQFPTAASCAAASLGDVLRLWQGLGYPRRARNLYLLAQSVSAVGAFPDTLEGLQQLPGVGPYTARAVLAFAFERDVAVVDTNIARVYARVLGAPLTQRQVQGVADSAVPDGDGWAWNQSLMDLGAVLCRPTSPNCGECPIRPLCTWGSADVEPSPVDMPTSTVDRPTRGADPAVGSAGVSGRQARFDGSDRQARGRLLAAVQHGMIDGADVPAAMQRDAATAERLLAALCTEGLVIVDRDAHRSVVRLPD
jgi:A/G-specific adenine glycosylase